MRYMFLLIFLLGTASSCFAQQASFAFGGQEMKRIGYSMFPKWAAMLARNTETIAPASGPSASGLPERSTCVPNPRFPCAVTADRYASFLDSNRALGREAQLKNINRFLNASPYITDPVNWGVSDYWAALREFMKKDGDCEDYAIAKYMTLKSLGWNVADMRVVVVQDENLNVPHAVLAVKLDGATWILDNQNQEMLPDRAIVHYRPFYSLNDQGFWIHAPKS
jgi:predicted transglutaminase-like cysteine proteinase